MRTATAERRAVEAFAFYQRQPARFVHEVLHAEPDPWQEEALEALTDGDVAVRSGHGVGKTALASWATIWALTVSGAVVPCTAPTQHQLADVLWPETRRWLERSGLLAGVTYTATRITVNGVPGAFAVARVSNRPEGLAGFHDERLLYVVDEASGIPDGTMAVVDGALTSERARCLMVGNPTQPTGYFVDAFGRNSWRWHGITVNAEESPRVSAGWVQEMQETWGRDSDIYRVRVLGLPPRGEAKGFIAPELVDGAFERWASAAAVGPLEIGVDVARYGEDKSAIAARRGEKTIFLQGRYGLSNPEVAAWALQVAQDHVEPGEKAILRVDDDGLGGGVTDMLRLIAREDSAAPITPMACTFGGKGDRWYANNTGVYWGAVRKLMQQGRLALPRNEELRQQLVTRQFAVNLKGKTVLEKKEQMKERGLRSPDLADALALAFAPSRTEDWASRMEERTPPCSSCAKPVYFAPGTDVTRCQYCGAENRKGDDDEAV